MHNGIGPRRKGLHRRNGRAGPGGCAGELGSEPETSVEIGLALLSAYDALQLHEDRCHCAEVFLFPRTILFEIVRRKPPAARSTFGRRTADCRLPPRRRHSNLQRPVSYLWGGDASFLVPEAHEQQRVDALERRGRRRARIDIVPKPALAPAAADTDPIVKDWQIGTVCILRTLSPEG